MSGSRTALPSYITCDRFIGRNTEGCVPAGHRGYFLYVNGLNPSDIAGERVLVSARFLAPLGNGLVLLRLQTLRAMAKGCRTKTKEWEMDR